MKRAIVLAACCCLVALTSGSEGPSTGNNNLVGLWKLVRIEVRRPGGQITTDPDLGPHAMGYIYYDATGHMGVQLMNPDRPNWKDEDHPTSDEVVAAVVGYGAYSGTYEVHEREGYAVHHPQLSLDPNEVGQEFRRRIELKDDELRLTPPPYKSWKGEMVDETLVWERVRPL